MEYWPAGSSPGRKAGGVARPSPLLISAGERPYYWPCYRPCSSGLGKAAFLLRLLPEDAEWRGKKDIRDAIGRGTKLWPGFLMPDEEGIAMENENKNENGVS